MCVNKLSPAYDFFFSYFSVAFFTIASAIATKGTKGVADGQGLCLWRQTVVSTKRDIYLLPQFGEQQRGEREMCELHNMI